MESDASALASSESTTVENIPNGVGGKSKKSKSKNKKQVCGTESKNENLDQQCSVSNDRDTGVLNVNKKSKKGSNSSQVTRSEDVEGHCGHFPVDDLVEFIDTGRKLNRTKLRHDYDDSASQVAAAGQKPHVIKKRSDSTNKYYGMENDSGYGDLENSDRGETGTYDGPLSPALSYGTDNSDVMAENRATNHSDVITQVVEASLESQEQELPTNIGITSDSWNHYKLADPACELPSVCFGEEIEMNFEDNFVVVQQKKRRAKAAKLAAAREDGIHVPAGQFPRVKNVSSRSSFAGRHRPHQSSSTENSTRSPSPSSVTNSDHSYESRPTVIQNIVQSGSEVGESVRITSCSHYANEGSRLRCNDSSEVLPAQCSFRDLSNVASFHTNRRRSHMELRGQKSAGCVVNQKCVTADCDGITNLPVLHVSRSNSQQSDSCVKTMDVGTMTLPDVVPDVERPSKCEGIRHQSTTVVYASGPGGPEGLSAPVISGVELGCSATDASDSLSTSADVSRTHSPCPISDKSSGSAAAALLPSHKFDLNAAQLFLHKGKYSCQSSLNYNCNYFNGVCECVLYL